YFQIKNKPLPMITLYNILQFLLLSILFLPLAIFVILVPKYRLRTLRRLGFGLSYVRKSGGKKTLWIHALSVGEVTSALPLVSGLRKKMPDVQLVFSASSRAGARVAEHLLHDKVDCFIPFPLDILPVINRFVNVIQPDLFILVETDFWPNILAVLRRRNIPTLLVNGRISTKSMRSYQRLAFFFRPLFSSFQALSMQTGKDRENLILLGVDKRQIHTFGNLKYDTDLYNASGPMSRLSFNLPEHQLLLVAGSTHKGEEKILLQSYKKLKKEIPGLYLIIAPRDVDRGTELQALASTMELMANCRSHINAGGKDLFILDTIGELSSLYSHADLAFIGGSLVPAGGHNPIEPAVVGVPVLYGPHMEDFSEISEELVQAGGATMVHSGDELTAAVLRLLQDNPLRKKAGGAARACIVRQQGVIDRHLKLINEML
ncbi:MAG: 3-deoxy-D-manno-octulosonic acid transferase, partial [Proteobacteria bacterium]|nr:3-deoxy-D-manno-octulosonic acid transferase [Pseudomonadota bacterium]